MKDLNNLSTDIIDELTEKRYAEYKCGIFYIKMYIIKELTDPDILYYKYIILNTPINSCTDIVSLFESFSEHITSKTFFDLKYMLFNKSVAPKIFTGFLTPLQPSFTLSYIAKNMPSVYNGREGLHVSRKYVNPSSLRITSKYLLMHYLKKYLSQYIYKTESPTPLVQIVTFNDKYIIDGKYSFVKQYLENPTKPIQILNLFYTNTPQIMCDFINTQAALLYNTKYQESPYESSQTVSDVVRKLLTLTNSFDLKANLKNNFNKLYQLHS